LSCGGNVWARFDLGNEDESGLDSILFSVSLRQTESVIECSVLIESLRCHCKEAFNKVDYLCQLQD